MAFTPKEREQIIEEETLRFETRRNLHAQRPCSGRRRLWPWCLAFFILGYAVHGLAARLCGRACPYESAGAGHAHCMFGQDPSDGNQPASGAPQP